MAVGESDSAFLTDIEFPFGKLAPGQTRKYSSPIEIPQDEPSAQRVVTLKFSDSNGNEPKPVDIVVPVKEAPKPEFSFKFDMPTVRKGKAMPKGPSIPLSVVVTNSGDGPSGEETALTVSNECGEDFFIEKGRTKIGALAPKARRRASFSFHFLKDAKPEKDCAIKLAVAHLTNFTIMSKRIELSPDKGTTRPAEGKTYGPPRIELSKAPETTSEDSVTIAGTIKDVDPIRDCFVFVGKRKVAYIPNADKSNTMNFSVNLPLEEGSNRISIGARDIEDIMSRKVIVIERRKGKKAKKAS